MTILNQNLPDELLNQFYGKARNKFGDKKGSKRTALLEAIQDWVKKEKGNKK